MSFTNNRRKPATHRRPNRAIKLWWGRTETYRYGYAERLDGTMFRCQFPPLRDEQGKWVKYETDPEEVPGCDRESWMKWIECKKDPRQKDGSILGTDGNPLEKVNPDGYTLPTALIEQTEQYSRGFKDGRSGDRPSELLEEYTSGYKKGRLEYLEKEREKELRR